MRFKLDTALFPPAVRALQRYSAPLRYTRLPNETLRPLLTCHPLNHFLQTRMLASPLMPGTAPTAVIFSPSHPTDEALQYRPAKDLESFNKLLPPPIEFVEGSSSGTLLVAEGKYEPINVSPKSQKSELPEKPKAQHPPANGHSSPVSAKSLPTTSLYHGGVDTSWPTTCDRGVGLHNTGNTCFLNSALQCLLHTPPLLRVLFAHHKEHCRVEKGFCMSCALRTVAVKAHSLSHAFTPVSISDRLQTIAKHMRRGRQEDSHEFLRYAVDALQKSCLAGYPPKLDPKLAETTWVHKIFGGRLRSRVTCHSCGYNSDTFDRILDLSLDILRSDSLKNALRKFVAIDYLKGADKYKCEKCKIPVIAEKRFTIHEAPMVLTVHLKRFSPMGRKISHYVDYEERLSLQPYMSEEQHGPSYSLYGVICHAGGGPNSGHYFAYIKCKENRWWEMNDEMVARVSEAPVRKKSAYILFYLRNKGQGLEAALNTPTPCAANPTPPSQKMGLAAGMKKRKERDPEGSNEDTGEKVTKPFFIGPVIPESVRNRTMASVEQTKDRPTDTQAKKSAKLVKEKAAGLLASLENYHSDDDDDEDGGDTQPAKTLMKESIENSPPKSSSPTKSSPSPSPTSPLLHTPAPSSRDRDGFNEKKRKQPDNNGENSRQARRDILGSRTSGYSSFRTGTNPYNRLSKRYGKRRPLGI